MDENRLEEIRNQLYSCSNDLIESAGKCYKIMTAGAIEKEAEDTGKDFSGIIKEVNEMDNFHVGCIFLRMMCNSKKPTSTMIMSTLMTGASMERFEDIADGIELIPAIEQTDERISEIMDKTLRGNDSKGPMSWFA
jgi:hypothetical protein